MDENNEHAKKIKNKQNKSKKENKEKQKLRSRVGFIVKTICFWKNMFIFQKRLIDVCKMTDRKSNKNPPCEFSKLKMASKMTNVFLS